jgi:DEAD/DEAH box helicase domain-containing protein
MSGHAFQPMLDPAALLKRLSHHPHRVEHITHIEHIPSRSGRTSSWPHWVHPVLRNRLEQRGIQKLWTHQVRAANLAWEGTSVVIATGTASGKSLGYLLPSLSAGLTTDPKSFRSPTTLYLSPTKALAADQLRSLLTWELPGVGFATCDGDSSGDERSWAQRYATYVLSNPDMLHRSILPGHRRWARFLRQLRYVVVDECHSYRGVFGSHVAVVLRRLRRLCALYGSSPVFILASATIAEASDVGRRLTGLPVTAVTRDDSPRPETFVACWEPSSRDLHAQTAELLADLVCEGAQTLAFVRSRRGAERVALWAQQHVASTSPGAIPVIASYRGGYLPEDRRAVERSLAAGDIRGLAATNALELGVDIGELDAVILSGYPGSQASLWQQIGRSGRAGRSALALLIARSDPLDTYLVRHPEVLFGETVETTVIDPENPWILDRHLCAAAAESPLTPDDEELLGATTSSRIFELERQGRLRRRPTGWYRTASAEDLFDLRGNDGPSITVVEQDTGRVLGTVDQWASHRTVHAGAVYVHQGVSYLVNQLDLEASLALVSTNDGGITTSAHSVTGLRILSENARFDHQGTVVASGTVEVSDQVVGYRSRYGNTGVVVGNHPLDLPPRIVCTQAVWWSVSDARIAATGLHPTHVAGAVHAIEHAAIGLLPLFASCDRRDVGGTSTARHPDTGCATVFVYDSHVGGTGFAQRGHHAAHRWLTATRSAIADCRCLQGCPSCIQSPQCGSGNTPLHKSGAILLLDALTSHQAVGSGSGRPSSGHSDSGDAATDQ